MQRFSQPRHKNISWLVVLTTKSQTIAEHRATEFFSLRFFACFARPFCFSQVNNADTSVALPKPELRLRLEVPRIGIAEFFTTFEASQDFAILNLHFVTTSLRFDSPHLSLLITFPCQPRAKCYQLIPYRFALCSQSFAYFPISYELSAS